MRRELILALLGLAALSARGEDAPAGPLGRWQTADSAGPSSELSIERRADGALSGRLQKLLRMEQGVQHLCKACTDDRKDQPLVGLEILRGAHQPPGEGASEEAELLDPKTGRTYKARLTPVDGGAKLEVRVSVGIFSQTQVWSRLP